MGWMEWDSNELSDRVAAGETDSVEAVVERAFVIPRKWESIVWAKRRMPAFAGMTRDGVR